MDKQLQDRLMAKAPLRQRLPVGTVLRIGHPANHIAWVKTVNGWITNHGKTLTATDMYDTLEHGAFEVLVGGLPASNNSNE